MNDADALVAGLQEIALAHVGLPHDEARARYPLSANTVSAWHSFEDALVDYYVYHCRACGLLTTGTSRTESMGRVKDLVEQVYRRRHSDIVGAYNDAHDGTNSGLRGVLDAVADALKMESIRHYVRDQFDSRVAPNDFDGKINIMRQFLQRFGPQLAGAVELHRPERYCNNYQDLVNAFVQGLRETSSLFRRL